MGGFSRHETPISDDGSGSDRRAWLLSADAAQQTATLQWGTKPGTAYEVQFTPGLRPANWQPAITVTGNASIASWEDNGAVSGTPPLSPAAPQRYYRIRQVNP